MPTFKHSGNLGDIIYSLPSVKKVGCDKFVVVYNKPINYMASIGSSHPMGDVFLKEGTAKLICEFLKTQSYIKEVELVQFGKKVDIDYDLDKIREIPINMVGGNIAKWYNHVTSIFPNIDEPWIEAEPNEKYNDVIIINRTPRYQSQFIDYSILDKIGMDNIVFFGLEMEYLTLKQSIPELVHVRYTKLEDYVKAIAGCKAFIGNGSFFYSIAEGLKVKRAIETSQSAPNCIPSGKNGYEFTFQKTFEDIIKILKE